MPPRTLICPQGHEKTGYNAIVRPGRGVDCRTCQREWLKEYKRKQRRARGAYIRDLDLSSGKKICSRCQIKKPLNAFAKRTDRKNGFQSWCRECFTRIRNPEAERERWRSDEYRTTARKRWLKGYGLTPEDFEEMMIDQEGRCAICGAEMILGGGKSIHPHIDHDHETGEVRGLLCVRCNMGLGAFLDDLEILKSAIAYRERTM